MLSKSAQQQKVLILWVVTLMSQNIQTDLVAKKCNLFKRDILTAAQLSCKVGGSSNTE